MTNRSLSPDSGDVTIVSRARLTEDSVNLLDPSWLSDLNAMRRNWEMWQETAKANLCWEPGERMVVIDRYQRVLTLVNEDGQLTNSLQWAKPDLSDVPSLAYPDARSAKTWLETEHPKHAPYEVLDFAAFARGQADRMRILMRMTENKLREIEMKHPGKVAKLEPSTVYLTALAFLAVEEFLSDKNGLSPVPKMKCADEMGLSRPVSQEDAVTNRSLSPDLADVMIVNRAGTTGISLHVSDSGDDRSAELDTMRRHFETWLDTACANLRFGPGKRMLVFDKYQRTLTQVNKDGRPMTTLQWAKPNLSDVVPLGHPNAKSVHAWLETEHPEYAPYKVCDFAKFALMQANRMQLVMTMMENRSRQIELAHPVELAKPDPAIVNLTAPPLAVMVELDSGVGGTSPCP